MPYQDNFIQKPASAGQIASQDDSANPSAPGGGSLVAGPDGRVQSASPTTNPTNAQIPGEPETFGDTGTDAQVRKNNQTQSTDGSQGQGKNPVTGETNPQPSANTEEGASAEGDDNEATLNETQTRVDEIFGQQFIFPQENVLDQYASYTWNASVYMLTDRDLRGLYTRKRKSVPNTQLLFRSGGAGKRGIGNTFNLSDIENIIMGKGVAFDLDYYIEEINMKSLVTGGGAGLANNVVEFDMKVIEPNGFTLLDKLYQSCVNLAADPTKPANYAAQPYLLVIRFWGYDENGNLVKAGTLDPLGLGLPGLIVEKHIPFVIGNVTTSVESKLVEYNWTCKVIPYQIALSQARGSIPYNIEISGANLKQLLGTNDPPETDQGNASGNGANEDDTDSTDAGTAEAVSGSGQTSTDSTTEADTAPPAPENANAAQPALKSSITGLMDTLNRFQRKLVRDGIYEVGDEYSLEFTEDILATATTRKLGEGLDKSTTPMDSSNSPDKELPDKQKMDTEMRTYQAVAGTQIVQFMDQVIRNSSYIQDQALFNYDEKTGAIIPNGNIAGKSVAWYKISVESSPIAMDAKRNDYAYKIKFIVSPYKVDNLNSVYFPRPQFSGVHKRYDYWFTGQNTQVLDFKQDFNSLYYNVISGAQQDILASSTAHGKVLTKRFYQPNSGQSSQGASGKTNEPAANAADYLYSPADQGTVSMKIIGDPAWIQQGESFAGFHPSQFNYSAFLPDGSINYDAQQILFELNFNLPSDYDLNKGLMQPSGSGGASGTGLFGSILSMLGSSANARQSYVYYATEVYHRFKGGMFTQDLKGKLRIVPLEEEKLQGITVTELQPGTTIGDTWYPPGYDVETEQTEGRDIPTPVQGVTAPDPVGVDAVNPDLGDALSTFSGVGEAVDSSNMLVSGTQGFDSAAQEAQPPTSDGEEIGLAEMLDIAPSSATATTPGALIDAPNNLPVTNEMVNPQPLPNISGAGVNIMQTQEYQTLQEANQNVETTFAEWQDLQAQSVTGNFPGWETGGAAREALNAARFIASEAKADYDYAVEIRNEAEKALNTFQSQTQTNTTQDPQIINRESQGG